jgi:nicotinamide-nucleotide amidase
MKAEIIAVGAELLTPDHTDTNSLYLTEKLNEAGFQVLFKTVVGDSEDDISEVLRSALRRSKIIVCTGGLGPTEDDLTRQAVARALGRPMNPDPDILEQLQQRFARRGQRMPGINERQAQVIAGAEVLKNSHGTAPGMWIEEKGSYIVLLPGPPREVKPMFETHVAPRVRELGRGRRLEKRSLHIAGLTESDVDSRVAPIYKDYSKVQTTILSSAGHIAIHLHQWLEASEEPSELEELAKRIQEPLADAVFTTSDEPLEKIVGDILRDSRRTLAVAESCTAGMIGMRITRIPGSSDYFLGGILCYSNEVKQNLCGVPESVLRNHGAVSAEAAEALALGIRAALGSSIGLSITGIAGPSGGTNEKPVGLVYIGIADSERCQHTRGVMPGDRGIIRDRATFLALSVLYRFLLEGR